MFESVVDIIALTTELFYLCLSFSARLASEFSHSIRSTAISQVSLTTSSSVVSSLRCFNNSKLLTSLSAPKASAASCLHIASSLRFSMTSLRKGTASSLPDCPRQYASSCFSNAEGDVKPAAIASTAGIVCSVAGFFAATCLSENNARNLLARAAFSSVRVPRRACIVASELMLEVVRDLEVSRLNVYG